MSKVSLPTMWARDLLVGGAAALVIGGLGWLSVVSVAPRNADASVRAFGTLLAVLFGIVSAIWWNQSAKLSNRLIDQDRPERQGQQDANILNGGAATFTALALFASVFASSPWKSTSSWLCSLGILLLLTMSGADIRQAVPISLRQRLQLREVIGLAGIAIVTLTFIWHLMT
jgi:UDP-N-acetylmuramyl pentapeptide phosphotransferase/UDP-N-acetylglucosamine-1-phosphate transferase